MGVLTQSASCSGFQSAREGPLPAVHQVGSVTGGVEQPSLVERGSGPNSVGSALEWSVSNMNGHSRRLPVKEKKPMDYPGDADVETYISQFSMIADYNGWQEEERKFHLAASLKDKARQVLPADGRLTSITYAQLCERLIKRFGPGKQAAPNVAALNSLARRSSETIRALADRARPYAKWGYPQVTDEETRDTLLIMPFISALIDKEQRTFVLNRKPATLEEAIEAAELFEATSGIEAKRSDASDDKAGKKAIRAVQLEADDEPDDDGSVISQLRAIFTSMPTPSSKPKGKNPKKKGSQAVRAVTSQVSTNQRDQGKRAEDPALYQRIQTIEEALVSLGAGSGLVSMRSAAGSLQTAPKTLDDGSRPTPATHPCHYCKKIGHRRNTCPELHRVDQENSNGRGPAGQAAGRK